MTESDFRTLFYERYDSTFKRTAKTQTPERIKGYQRWCKAKILPLLDGVEREGRILELGCGQGNLLALLAQEGFRKLQGIDVSPEQVALARERGLDVTLADARAFLSAVEQPYAAIVGLDFVEHFTKSELLELAARIHDVLEPGGVLLLQTPNGAGLFPDQVARGDLTHLTILTPSSLEQLLTLTGFDEIVFRETGPVPGSVVGIVRWVLWQLIRTGADVVRRIETGKSQQIWTENVICRAERSRA